MLVLVLLLCLCLCWSCLPLLRVAAHQPKPRLHQQQRLSQQRITWSPLAVLSLSSHRFPTLSFFFFSPFTPAAILSPTIPPPSTPTDPHPITSPDRPVDQGTDRTAADASAKSVTAENDGPLSHISSQQQTD